MVIRNTYQISVSYNCKFHTKYSFLFIYMYPENSPCFIKETVSSRFIENLEYSGKVGILDCLNTSTQRLIISFLSLEYKLWGLFLNFDWLLQKWVSKSFNKLFVIYRRGNLSLGMYINLSDIFYSIIQFPYFNIEQSVDSLPITYV